MAQARVAIVTGGASGIGTAIAQRLAGGGWQVVIGDVKATTDVGGAISVIADVGTEDGVAALVEAARSSHGRIDAIVANAAINPRGPLSELTLQTWNRALAINLTSTMLLARAAEADLRSAKGAIVAITSTRAHMSEAETLPYSASKGGLVALTHALAMTLAPDVRVNCISPGWIDTGKWGPLKPGDHAQHPVGRVGVPEDIAAAVEYLLSDAAHFMTGAELVIDGGMTRKMIYR